MKRLLLSMTLLFAFGLTSQAQFGPGEDGRPGLPDPCHPDLTVTGWSAPSSVAAGSVVTITVYIANLNECFSPAGTAYVSLETFPSSVANILVVTSMPALGFQESSEITVEVDLNSAWYPGMTSFNLHCTLDPANDIAETNEGNNYSAGPSVTVIP